MSLEAVLREYFQEKEKAKLNCTSIVFESIATLYVKAIDLLNLNSNSENISVLKEVLLNESSDLSALSLQLAISDPQDAAKNFLAICSVNYGELPRFIASLQQCVIDNDVEHSIFFLFLENLLKLDAHSFIAWSKILLEIKQIHFDFIGLIAKNFDLIADTLSPVELKSLRLHELANQLIAMLLQKFPQPDRQFCSLIGPHLIQNATLPFAVINRCLATLTDVDASLELKLTNLSLYYMAVDVHKELAQTSNEILSHTYRLLQPELFLCEERDIVFDIIEDFATRFSVCQRICFFRKILFVATLVPTNCCIYLVNIAALVAKHNSELILPLLHINPNLNVQVHYLAPPLELPTQFELQEHVNGLTISQSTHVAYGAFEFIALFNHSDQQIRLAAQMLIRFLQTPMTAVELADSLKRSRELTMNAILAKQYKSAVHALNACRVLKGTQSNAIKM